MKKRISIVAIVALILIIFAAFSYQSQKPSVENIRFGFIGESIPWFLTNYADVKGIFEKNDLNITKVSIQDPYTQLTMLGTGKIDFAAVSAGLTGRLQGQEVGFRIIYAFREPDFVIVRDYINSFEDLKGKKLAVISKASDAYFIYKSYAETKGIDLQAEVDIIEINIPPLMVASFQKGEVDALITWLPFAVDAIDSGGKVLMTSDDAFTAVTGHIAHKNLWIVREDYFIENPDVVDQVIRSYDEAIRLLKENELEAVHLYAELTGDSVEFSQSVISMRNYRVGHIDDAIIDDLNAFYDFALEKDYLETSHIPSDDAYYVLKD